MNEYLIFINWSGVMSREVAHILKDLLCDLYRKIDSTQIFVSDTSLAGSLPWIETIRNAASQVRISIPCLTIDNTSAPWIHFEVGLCSGIFHNMEDSRKEKAIIPFLFNFDIKDLDKHLSMLSCHQSVSTDMTLENEHERFQNLLYSFIHQVDHCLADKGLGDYSYGFGDNESYLHNVCSGFLGNYVQKLTEINQKYRRHDYYISRPMFGANPTVSNDISSILKQIMVLCKNKRRIYYSDGISKYDKDSLLESRVAIIKKCNSFLLIYPKIDNCDMLPPSSCLIELGAALASDSEIILCIQNKAVVPSFIQEKLQEDVEGNNYKIHIFDDIADLSKILSDIMLDTKSK